MLKLKIFAYAMVAIVLGTTLTSCEDWLDVNTDPNNPVHVEPNLTLPVAEAYTAHYISADRRISHLGNMFMANWSESHGFSWSNDEFRYNVTSTFYTGVFDQAFSRSLKEYQNLVNLEGEYYSHYKAIGMIMKSYHYQILVDTYGDVPYFEALQRSNNPTPKYDDAATIYRDLIVQLNEAKTLLATTPEQYMKVGADDIIFKGNTESWIKFANTVKGRILARLSGKSAEKTSSAFVDLITEEMGKMSEGTITADVIVNPGYVNEANKQNPFWAAFGKGVDGSDVQNWRATPATEYILTLLNSKSDPRVDKLFARPIDNPDAHKGWNQGIEPNDDVAYSKVSLIGTGLLKGATAGQPIFTLAENYFNLAELALKGYGGDDKALYENGVKASFRYLGLTDANATTYLSQEVPFVQYPSSNEDKLHTIIYQKRIAVMGITAEQSWYDYNRYWCSCISRSNYCRSTC
jgi:hypothetical protein